MFGHQVLVQRAPEAKLPQTHRTLEFLREAVLRRAMSAQHGVVAKPLAANGAVVAELRLVRRAVVASQGAVQLEGFVAVATFQQRDSNRSFRKGGGISTEGTGG